MKLVFSSLLVALVWTSQAQAGFWDWLPGRGKSCSYSERELRSVLPREREEAKKYTPISYPVERFEIKTAFDKRPWLRDFRYIVVVNKAAAGPTAQTVRIYEDGYLLATDKVSTGREQLELGRRSSKCVKQPPNSYYSVTATGYYPIQWINKDHRSGSFDADMPYAMFYDRKNGLALHQVMNAYLKKLGTRASGGCTRMREDIVSDLFSRVERTRGAEIPMVQKDGTVLLDENGNVRKTRTNEVYNRPHPAFSAIVIIEDVAN
jgi:Uncharacterized protein conserved in bacteria